MINRIFYFWLERLKIHPAERKAVVVLTVVLVLLAAANLALEQHAPYGDAHYAELEHMFEQRTALLREQEAEIMARYQPAAQQVMAPVADTLTRDTLESAPDEQGPDRDAGGIDINTAGIGQLESLPGIGPVYARRIIEYRSTNGAFVSVDELLKIKGIGKKRLEKLKPFIKLKGSTANQ